jgi:ubiquinone/menaquinone biosynthesis C-methylase UbiE
MAQMFQNRFTSHFSLERHDLALDIGCGVGAATITHSQNFKLVFGVDWNLADLILFRKSLDEQGVSNIVLLQANLLQLPLAASVCDYVTALNVIEHMLDTNRGFEEIARILRPGGGFCGDSRNRFDILFPEPHVRLRMLGFLPRQSAIEYVRRRRGMSYAGTRLLSYWELDRLLATHFRDYRIVYPEVSAYGASRHIDAWIRFFETKLTPLSKLVLPFFTTMVAVGQR